MTTLSPRRKDSSAPSHENTVKAAVNTELLPWFSKNRRDLPWRKNRTPYRVWVAEIMLQQTRVDTVIDYYRRWMNAFPTWKALAAAPQSDVLKCWEGLGYYSRARNLHKAAGIICDDLNIKNLRDWKIRAETFQCLEKFLRNFPGIGNYTAAAIASLAFNEDAAVVDGNVIRVLSRLEHPEQRPVHHTSKHNHHLRYPEIAY